MTPSTQLNWIILTVIGIVIALIAWLAIFLSQRSLARKRAKFKPSVIVLYSDMLFKKFVIDENGEWIRVTSLKEYAQILIDYDQAITLLSAIKEKYPNAELKEI